MSLEIVKHSMIKYVQAYCDKDLLHRRKIQRDTSEISSYGQARSVNREDM